MIWYTLVSVVVLLITGAVIFWWGTKSAPAVYITTGMNGLVNYYERDENQDPDDEPVDMDEPVLRSLDSRL